MAINFPFCCQTCVVIINPVITTLHPSGHALSWDEIIYTGGPEECKFAAFYVK